MNRPAALLLVAACCPLQSASALEGDVPAAIFPALPLSAPEAAGFAPAGWIVEAKASGDLDGDGVDDLALVLHATDPKNRVPTGREPGAPTFDSNPRILAFALGNRDGKGYRLALEERAVIPRRISSTQDDAFEEPGAIVIRAGMVHLTLSYFSSAGGWDAGSRTLKFRYRNGVFALVGLEGHNVHRASGETRDTSVNFLTGRAVVKTCNIAAERATARRYVLDGRDPPTIVSVGDGLACDPLVRAQADR